MEIKKCHFCDKETRKSRNDFAEINWNAIQFGKDKMICACYEHHENLMRLIKEKLKKFTKKGV